MYFCGFGSNLVIRQIIQNYKVQAKSTESYFVYIQYGILFPDTSAFLVSFFFHRRDLFCQYLRRFYQGTPLIPVPNSEDGSGFITDEGTVARSDIQNPNRAGIQIRLFELFHVSGSITCLLRQTLAPQGVEVILYFVILYFEAYKKSFVEFQSDYMFFSTTEVSVIFVCALIYAQILKLIA